MWHHHPYYLSISGPVIPANARDLPMQQPRNTPLLYGGKFPVVSAAKGNAIVINTTVGKKGQPMVIFDAPDRTTKAMNVWYNKQESYQRHNQESELKYIIPRVDGIDNAAISTPATGSRSLYLDNPTHAIVTPTRVPMWIWVVQKPDKLEHGTK